MRSPLVRWVVSSRINALTGLELQAERVYIELDGSLVVRKMELFAPGVAGEAGRVLTSQRTTVELDWSGILTGNVAPIGVRLWRPAILVSQSTDNGELNLSALKSGAGTPGASAPPEIAIVDATIRLAEHDRDGKVTVLKDIMVGGSLLPVRLDGPVFSIALTETRPEGVSDGKPMILDGRLDLGAGQSEIHLRNIALEDWSAESIPSSFREVWAKLNVRGEVTRIDLTSVRGASPVMKLALSDVRMGALVPAEGTKSSSPDLALRGVNGVVQISRDGLQAQLEGQIEGQQGRSRVKIKTDGIDLNAPLTCEIRGSRIQVAKDPAFLAYVPATVRQYFEYFSGPTADVDVIATISRGPPSNGVAADFTVGGTLSFRNGSAAFHKFPYPFHELSGIVRFDETSITIDQIRGRGPTGATLQATGKIGPLTDDAKVDVRLDVARTPVDEHLLAAMPKNRREALETIFDRTEYDRLLKEGGIRRPGEPGIDGTRFAPPCPFAGDADIGVHITRELGAESIWTTDVDVRFKDVGIVATPFPLPIVGRDVRVRISDDDAKIVSGQFVGPRGGAVRIDASVIFFENGQRVVKPKIQVGVTDLPVDDLLVRAINHTPAQDTPSNAPANVDAEPPPTGFAAALQRVRLGGTVDAIAQIIPVPPPDEGPAIKRETDYDITVTLDGLRALPLIPDRLGDLALADFLGTLRLTPERVLIEGLQARLVRTGSEVGPTAASELNGPSLPAGPADAGHLSISLDAARESSPQSGRLSAVVRVLGLNLADKVEQVVGVVAPDAARWLTDNRDRLQPDGLIDATVRAGRGPIGPSLSEEPPPDLSISLDRAHDVEFSALGGRFGVDVETGAMLAHVPPAGFATFRAAGADARLSWNGQPAGAARIDGLLTIDPDKLRLAEPSSAQIELAQWAFESHIVPPMLRFAGGADTVRSFEELRPTGVFDASLVLGASPVPGRSSPSMNGEIRPHSLSITRADRRIEFESVLGSLSFASGIEPGTFSGCINNVAARTGAWTISADGSFGGDEHEVALDLALAIDAHRMDHMLLALIPESARGVLEQLDVSIDGPVALRDSRLSGLLDSPVEPLVFSGTIDVADARLNCGVAIEDLAGQIDLAVASYAEGGPDRVDVTLRAPALKASGIGLQDLLVHAATLPRSVKNARDGVESGGGEGGGAGAIHIDTILATAHAGRIAGQAVIMPPPASDPAAPRGYQVDLVVAGVAFAPLLQELSVTGAVEPLVGPVADESRDPDISRGRLDARISLTGIGAGQGSAAEAESPRPAPSSAASRVGRGAIRIQHGDVLRLPVIFPLMQLSNFVLPSDDRLRSLEAEFSVAGPRIDFSRVVASGQTIALEGSGVMTWPETTLDFSFNSRSLSRVPLISPLYEALRNEIITTSITGTLKDPVVKSDTLAGVRRMLARIFAPDPAPPALPVADTAAASEAHRAGLRRADGRVIPTIAPDGRADAPVEPLPR